MGVAGFLYLLLSHTILTRSLKFSLYFQLAYVVLHNNKVWCGISSFTYSVHQIQPPFSIVSLPYTLHNLQSSLLKFHMDTC
jgi:hypothetical protein